MANPVGYTFTNQMKNVYGRDGVNAEYKRFSEEYFSGADVRIYFGSTWVDEVVGLQFSMQENAAPIFGYASYTYDRMAVGSRQIQGTFRINFKESYYLHFITNRLDSEIEEATDSFPSNTNQQPQATGSITPEHLLSAGAGEDFEKLALQFEKSLWSSATDSNFTGFTNNKGDASFFANENSRSSLAKQGFNIVILYGPYTQSYDPSAPTESVATTAHTLTGVYITGVQQVIDNSGQPLFEEYSFIAKDLDANVNLYKPQPSYSFGKVVK